MSGLRVRELPATLQLGGGISALALLAAAIVAISCPADARHALDFPFPGVRPTLANAASIFANNAKLMLASLALALVVQAPLLEDRRRPAPQWHRALVRGCDTLLALPVAANATLVGAALGAYGGRMARALLPHGPVELAAFALALTVYLEARRGPMRPRRAAALVAASFLTLALAALLETYITV
jgi:hypothetical protein